MSTAGVYNGDRTRMASIREDGIRCYKRIKGSFVCIGIVSTEEEMKRFLRGSVVRFRLFRRE